MTLARRAAIAILEAPSAAECARRATDPYRAYRADTQPIIEGVVIKGMWFEDAELADTITGEDQ